MACSGDAPKQVSGFSKEVAGDLRTWFGSLQVVLPCIAVGSVWTPPEESFVDIREPREASLFELSAGGLLSSCDKKEIRVKSPWKIWGGRCVLSGLGAGRRGGGTGGCGGGLCFRRLSCRSHFSIFRWRAVAPSPQPKFLCFFFSPQPQTHRGFGRIRSAPGEKRLRRLNEQWGLLDVRNQ